MRLEDLQELVRLLNQHPDWAEQLRRALFPGDGGALAAELRALAAEVRALAEAQRHTDQRLAELAEAQRHTNQRLAELAEAQRHTDQRLAELAEAQKRTEERLGTVETALAQLAEAQKRTEERLGTVETALAQLAEAQKRTEERLGTVETALAQLAEAQRHTEQRMAELAETVRLLVRDVGELKGQNLERLYRERAASYFQRIVRRVRTLDPQQLGLLLDDAVDAGSITLSERADALEADVVLEGLHEGEDVYLVAEVSWQVSYEDAERAARRAEVLQRALGRRVLPAVAGKTLADDPQTREAVVRVWRVLDGRTEPPASC
ncbi:MAG: hypothetical protein QN185_12020 [Armatimonadota bacterium]|nr:hypothetical protein [Armatimonadota bacterium]